MNYLILITEESKPVLVEVPEKPIRERFGTQSYYEKYMADYEQALTAAISDKSKHIQFKDKRTENSILTSLYAIEYHNGKTLEHITDWKPKVGQTFPLPDNVGVTFEQRCGCHFLKGPSKECLEAGGKNPYKCVKENIKLAILSPVVAPSEEVKQKDKVFEFCYNDCIYESAAYTVSIHKTRAGAERAMEIHKEFAKKEWNERYKPEDEMGEFDEMSAWFIREREVLE